MPVADKLIQVAETYGFDGWFINQETEGAEERTLTRDDAVKMQEFIKYFKKQAHEMRLVYYDSMTSEGKMDWQNALTDKNTMFMTDEEGNEFYYREELIIPVGDKKFALLVGINEDEEHDCGCDCGCDDEDVFIARIDLDENGEVMIPSMQINHPDFVYTDEEFEEVQKAYDELMAEEEE